MITFYKVHKQDYYCRQLPYRIFKCGCFWRVQRLPINPNENIELYADRFQQAKDFVEQQANRQAGNYDLLT